MAFRKWPFLKVDFVKKLILAKVLLSKRWSILVLVNFKIKMYQKI